MDYNRITDFLGKFKKILSDTDDVYSSIVAVVRSATGVELQKNNIKISGTSIHIKGSPMQKSQILIYKDKIIADIAKILPDKKFLDIR
jgi:hypothetical protein